jgi:phosphatidylserine decarboxylase
MIARDGLSFILVSLVLTILFLLGALKWDSHWLITITALFALLTIFITYFFRDPERSVDTNPLSLVAPADGRIVAIEPMNDHPFLQGPGIRISIFLSVFDVHINRIPAGGTVEYVKYNPGKFFAAFEDKASDLNEQTEIGIVTPSGYHLVVKQIAGIIARRIVCRLQQGDSVTTGERFGMIRFGSRTDLIVPADCEIQVSKGNHVKGAESVICLLPAKPVTKNPSNVKESNNADI